MAEYIEKEKLLYEFREIMPDIGINKLADELYNVAFNLPSADVAPVKHGKWNRTTSDYECSNCQYPMDYITPYCPNCGAKMDLE